MSIAVTCTGWWKELQNGSQIQLRGDNCQWRHLKSFLFASSCIVGSIPPCPVSETKGSWQWYLWKLQGEVFTMALFKEEFLQQEPPCSHEPLSKNFNSLKYFLKMGTLSRRTSTVPLQYLACAGPYRTSLPLHPKTDKELEHLVGKETPEQASQRNMLHQLYQVVPSYKPNGVVQCVVIISALIPILSVLHISICCKLAMQCYCWGKIFHEIRPNLNM